MIMPIYTAHCLLTGEDVSAHSFSVDHLGAHFDGDPDGAFDALVGVLAKIHHHCFLPFYGFIPAGDAEPAFIITQRVTGRLLVDVLNVLANPEVKDAPIIAAWKRADKHEILLVIAIGLAYLHGQGITHGALTTSTILLDERTCMHPTIIGLTWAVRADPIDSIEPASDISAYGEILEAIVTDGKNFDPIPPSATPDRPDGNLRWRKLWDQCREDPLRISAQKISETLVNDDFLKPKAAQVLPEDDSP
jgi:serine/threonine protein kinase